MPPKSPKPKSPKPRQSPRQGKRKRGHEEEPELFTPDNQPSKKPARQSTDKAAERAPPPPPETDPEPGTSTGGPTTGGFATAGTVNIIVEDPIPPGKNRYSPEPDNWLGKIPDDHCKYIQHFYF